MRVRLLAMMLLCCMPCHAVAADDSLLQSVLQRLAQIDGFQCVFEQTLYYTDGSTQSYAGDLAIAKPGKFRWQYQKPYAQLYVSNGQGIWHYEEDLMQAEWLPQLDSVDPVVMQLLEGRISTQSLQARDVTVTMQDVAAGIQVYGLQLEGTPVWLAVYADGSGLAWIESKDTLGNRNRMALSKMKYHAPAWSAFEFIPPEGVDVIKP